MTDWKASNDGSILQPFLGRRCESETWLIEPPEEARPFPTCFLLLYVLRVLYK